MCPGCQFLLTRGRHMMLLTIKNLPYCLPLLIFTTCKEVSSKDKGKICFVLVFKPKH